MEHKIVLQAVWDFLDEGEWGGFTTQGIQAILDWEKRHTTDHGHWDYVEFSEGRGHCEATGAHGDICWVVWVDRSKR